MNTFLTYLLLGILGIGFFIVINKTIRQIRIWLVRRSIQNQLLDFTKNSGLLAIAQGPEAVFEHNLKVFMDMGDKENAAALLHSAIVRKVIKGEQPCLVDVQRIQELGYLKTADEKHIKMCPDAAYVLEIVKGIILFSSDLSPVHLKKYDKEVDDILNKVMKNKKLEEDDKKSLEKMFCPLRKSEPLRGVYGGPGFPYPDERYYIMERLDGKRMTFAFDENLDLIVAMDYSDSTKDVVIWERPGARKPELYEIQTSGTSR